MFHKIHNIHVMAALWLGYQVHLLKELWVIFASRLADTRRKAWFTRATQMQTHGNSLP